MMGGGIVNFYVIREWGKIIKIISTEFNSILWDAAIIKFLRNQEVRQIINIEFNTII